MVATQPSVIGSPSFRFRSASMSHAGAVRKLNRDACLERPDVGLWAVADGMGGDQSAGIGASAIVRALAGVDDFETAFLSRRAMRAALVRVNLDLVTRAAEDSIKDVGASVVTFLARETSYACMWVGTSRAYLLRSGVLHRLSRDHTVAQELIDAGKLDEAEGGEGYKVKTATRAVGARLKLEIEGGNGEIQARDRILLCSDGLTVIDEGEIAELMSQQISTASVAAALTKKSLELSAPDNVSVVVCAAFEGCASIGGEPNNRSVK